MAEEPRFKVLAVDVVRAAIEELRRRPIHEHFPGFLVFRRALLLAKRDHLPVDTKLLEPWITVEGGGPKRPYYRPFSLNDFKDLAHYWANDNLPGSYSKSSVRPGSPMASFYTEDREHFYLPPNSAEIARDRMLKGMRIPAWAIAAYFLRDFGFEFGGPGGHDELLAGFRREFTFESGADFETLFDSSPPASQVTAWFVESSPAGESISYDGPRAVDGREQADG